MPIDGYYETSYTSNTCNGIVKIYKEVIFKCKNCNNQLVDTKMAIQDTTNPTFVILRKRYCHTCWILLVTT